MAKASPKRSIKSSRISSKKNSVKRVTRSKAMGSGLQNLKNHIQGLSYNQRGVIYLITQVLIIYGIWGFYTGNFSRLYAYSQRPNISITLPHSYKLTSLTSINDLNHHNPVQMIGYTVPETVVSTPKSKKPKTVPKVVVPSGPAQTNPQFSTYPTWSQDFLSDHATEPSSKYWNVYQGIPQNSNKEAEYYTNKPTNLRIQNGALTLEATQQSEPDGYSYGSARIDTENKKSFLYGRVDITAIVPNGVGTWPAAWFLPANDKYESLSPPSDSLRYMNGGEIDLIEEVGSSSSVEYGIVHSISDLSNPNGVGDYSTVSVANGNTTYNVYSLLWTPTTITFEVNNVPFYVYTRETGANYQTWPFDQPFYLVLNLAIGGTWGAENTSVFPTGIDNSALPASFDIQSIYYYSYTGA
jgi:beta-glucanase (GH16 family)